MKKSPRGEAPPLDLLRHGTMSVGKVASALQEWRPWMAPSKALCRLVAALESRPRTESSYLFTGDTDLGNEWHAEELGFSPNERAFCWVVFNIPNSIEFSSKKSIDSVISGLALVLWYYLGLVQG